MVGLVAGQAGATSASVGPVPVHRASWGWSGRRCPWGCRPAPGRVGRWWRCGTPGGWPAGCPAASVTSSLCLVTDRVMPMMSHSWNASVPIAAVGDLAGDDDHRDRVHVGVASGVTMLVAAGPAGHHGHAGATGGVGVALGHVPGTLLVAHEDVADRAVDDRVVHREDRAAGEAEDDLDALELEGADQRLHHRWCSCRCSCFWGVGRSGVVRVGGATARWRKTQRPPVGEVEGTRHMLE